MALWMNEAAEAIVTRPALEDLPFDYTQCIKCSPTCCGYLEKLSSSRWAPRWQIRYFELIGHYLIYNNQPQLSDVNMSANSPLCYIDLRQVTIDVSNSSVYLISNDRQLRIRKCRDVSRDVSNDSDAQNPNPELSEWIIQLRRSQNSKTLLSNIESHDTENATTDIIVNNSAKNEDIIEAIPNETHNQQIPAWFKRYMIAIGVIPSLENNEWSIRIMWFKRVLILLLFGLLPIIDKLASKTPTKCANSTSYKDSGKEMPCILLFAFYIDDVMYYATIAIVYYWLLKYGTQFHELIRTHRLRMVHQINRFARYWFYFQIIMTSLWLVSYTSYGFDPKYMVKVDNKSHLEYVCRWLLFIVICIIMTLCVLWSIIPIIVISTMYYAESRRLRYLLKDFTDYMQQKPFNMKLISCAYVEMHNEWKRTQSRMGIIMSVLTVGILVEVLSTFIVSFYTLNGLHLALGVHWWSFAIACIQYFPMLLVILTTVTAANKRATKLRDQCTALIADSLIESDDITELESTTDKQELRSRFGSSLEYDQAELIELGRMKRGQDVMKLCDLVERLPCDLRLLGKPVSESDIIYFCGFLVLVQVVNLFGVAWAIPL